MALFRAIDTSFQALSSPVASVGGAFLMAATRARAVASWAPQRSPSQSPQPSGESGMVSGVSPEFVTGAR